jgi:DNA-binding LytR/AlgR family response regulator
MSEKRLTAIVVEDERLPRLSLLQKLEEMRQQVEVLDSCDNYDSALQSIVRYKPDLLLLDIQLRGRNSMELLEELKAVGPLPQIIFTTAYNERGYLMKAIKLQAADYLLKPIDKNELALAIAKVAAKGRTPKNPPPAPPQGRGDWSGRLSFRTANGRVFMDEGDIAYIMADGNYAQLTGFHGRDMVLENLSALEGRLDGERFVRIDRSTIVNVKSIYRLNAKRRTCTLMAADGTTVELQLSKSGMEKLMG